MMASRWTPFLAALLAVTLSLPSVWMGLAGDDYFHQAMLRGLGDLADRQPLWDLFSFMPGGEASARYFELGLMPWWSDPDLRAAFFRPATALTHMLDHALWPDRPVLQHLHSLLWCGLAVLIVARAYRALPVSALAAGAAALLFAVEDAHAVTVGWIANRNALLCLAFGGLAMWGHITWRRSGDGRALLGAWLSVAVGLLCGEATLGAVAYIAAYQLTMDDGPWRRRLGALLPYALLVVAWRVAYNMLGYGASGSGLYIDPGRQPLDFALALVERWPMLFAGLWLQLPIDAWMVLHRPYQLTAVAASIAGSVCVGIWLAPAIRQRPAARLWLLGMAFSIVPLCAAFPMDRLLLFPGIGAFGLLGLLLAHPQTGWRRRVTVGMLIVHGPLAAVLLFAKNFTLPVFGLVFSAGARHAPTHPELTGQTLVFVNGTEIINAYVPIMRMVEPSLGPVPRRMAHLSAMTTPTRVLREDEDTLVVEPEGGLLRGSLERLFWGTGHRFAEGEVVVSVDFDAEVREVTDDGRPAVVAYHFRRPLDASEYCFVYWTEGGLLPFPLPEAGDSVLLPVALPAL